jgi:hypothetical protein
MKNLKFLPLALVTILTFTSCDNDAEEVNEEEVITTVTTTLTGGGTTIVLKSTDLDGDGPNLPVFSATGGDLKVNTKYTGSTTFMNELANPAEDITSEVAAEGDEHQVFYQAPATIGAFTYKDTDNNAKPIGLSFELQTGAAAANGNLVVTLRHLPNKSAAGVATGDITSAGGATDAAVTFPVKVVL